MYPFKSIVIGCNPDVLALVRRQLLEHHVHVEAEFPYASAAIDSLAVESQWTGAVPVANDALLLILYLPSVHDLTDLKKLRSSFPNQPIMVVVDATLIKPASLILLMREGACQILLLPVQAEDFRSALDCIQQQFRTAAPPTKVVAVAGATGGCGSTTLAINLAFEIAHSRKTPLILAELSLQMGVVAAYLNVEPTFTTHDLLRDVDRLDTYAVQKSLLRVGENLEILVGPHQTITPARATPPQVLRIIDVVRRLAEVVVLDVPCTYDDIFFQVLAAADQVVLVGEQKVPSIRALKMVQDTLQKESPLINPFVVINRYQSQLPSFHVRDLEKLLEKRNIHTVANDFAAVNGSINHGVPIQTESPRSPILADIAELGRTVLGDNDSPTIKADSVSLMGRLVQVFRLA